MLFHTVLATHRTTGNSGAVIRRVEWELENHKTLISKTNEDFSICSIAAS